MSWHQRLMVLAAVWVAACAGEDDEPNDEVAGDSTADAASETGDVFSETSDDGLAEPDADAAPEAGDDVATAADSDDAATDAHVTDSDATDATGDVDDATPVFDFTIEALTPRSISNTDPERMLIAISATEGLHIGWPDIRIGGLAASVSPSLDGLAGTEICDLTTACWAVTAPAQPDAYGEQEVEVEIEGIVHTTWIAYYVDVAELAPDGPAPVPLPGLTHADRAWTVQLGTGAPVLVTLELNAAPADGVPTPATVRLFELGDAGPIARGSADIEIAGGLDDVALEPRGGTSLQRTAPSRALSYKAHLVTISAEGADAAGIALLHIRRNAGGTPVLDSPHMSFWPRIGQEVIVDYYANPPKPGLVLAAGDIGWRTVALVASAEGVGIAKSAKDHGEVGELSDAPASDLASDIPALAAQAAEKCLVAPDPDADTGSTVICLGDDNVPIGGGVDIYSGLLDVVFHEMTNACPNQTVIDYDAVLGFGRSHFGAADAPDLYLAGTTDQGVRVVDVFERQGTEYYGTTYTTLVMSTNGYRSPQVAFSMLGNMMAITSLGVDELNGGWLYVDGDFAEPGEMPTAPLPPGAFESAAFGNGGSIAMSAGSGLVTAPAPTTAPPFAEGSLESGGRLVLAARHFRVEGGLWTIAQVTSPVERAGPEAIGSGHGLITFEPPEEWLVFTDIETRTTGSLLLEGLGHSFADATSDGVTLARVAPVEASDTGDVTIEIGEYLSQRYPNNPSPKVFPFGGQTCLAKLTGAAAGAVIDMAVVDIVGDLFDIAVTTADRRAWVGSAARSAESMTLEEILVAGDVVPATPRTELVITRSIAPPGSDGEGRRPSRLAIVAQHGAADVTIIGKMQIDPKPDMVSIALSVQSLATAARLRAVTVNASSGHQEILALARSEDGAPEGLYLIDPYSEPPSIRSTPITGSQTDALSLLERSDIAAIGDFDLDGADDLLLVPRQSRRVSDADGPIARTPWLMASRFGESWRAPVPFPAALGVLVGPQDPASLAAAHTQSMLIPRIGWNVFIIANGMEILGLR